MAMMEPSPRLLFLDDDPHRAAAFGTEHPHMVWVQTVEECLRQLEEPWDEVHLDHDLGGEILVDIERDDCGMEVVRWLSERPRDHLMGTAFFIHSHNMNAACVMALHLQVMGYRVEARPFRAASPGERSGRGPRDRGLLGRLRSLFATAWQGPPAP